MEFAVDDRFANYAGGLGVLAADMMMSAADLGEKMVGVSLLYKPENFHPRTMMKKMKERVFIVIDRRKVEVEIWQADISGTSGRTVPVIFLSTDHSGNGPKDRGITKRLYPDEPRLRFSQLAVLGIGGFRALKALGYRVDYYHMNEGHAALCALELLLKTGDIKKTRGQCSFTTHTPVSSGHDYFDWLVVYKILGDKYFKGAEKIAKMERLGTTELALFLSKRSNSVSLLHNKVCLKMFPKYKLANITNGVYHPRWIGPGMKRFLDEHFESWMEKPDGVRVGRSHLTELVSTRKAEKKDFVGWINANKDFFPFERLGKNDQFREDVLTIGWGRRIVPYKRIDLILNDIEGLRKIAKGKLQIVFAGFERDNDLGYSAHVIRKIRASASVLRGDVRIVHIPDYNLEIAKRLVSGCDAWLNTPYIGNEASGTSGMKAAFNGVLNVSIMDGWWIEGVAAEPDSGFSFGKPVKNQARQNDADSKDLLKALSKMIRCYENEDEWMKKACNSINLIGKFNSHRVVKEYFKKMWRA